jgi:hypothetical protein
MHNHTGQSRRQAEATSLQPRSERRPRERGCQEIEFPCTTPVAASDNAPSGRLVSAAQQTGKGSNPDDRCSEGIFVVFRRRNAAYEDTILLIKFSNLLKSGHTRTIS